MYSKRTNKKRKILIVANGGIAIEEGNIAFTGNDMGPFISSLNKNGFEVIYAGSRGSSKNNKFIYTFNLNENRIKYFVIKGGRRNPLRYIGFLKLAYFIIISESGYLFYPGGFSNITARLYKFFRKKYGVFVRGYGLYIPDAKRKSEPENVFTEWFILKKASYLITVSPKMRSELLTFNKNVSTMTDIIWDLKDAYYKRNMNFNISFWRFLFVGSITELKGITELLESAKILNGKGLDFRLRIVGDGYLLQDLVNKQNKGEIPSNIEFTGSITDKESLEQEFQKADALLLPSRTEGFPRILYEAMLKGLPIFTTMAGGIRGIMEPGYNCVELPARDPIGQAKEILSGIGNPELMKRISENGLVTVKDILMNKEHHHKVLIKSINSSLKNK